MWSRIVVVSVLVGTLLVVPRPRADTAPVIGIRTVQPTSVAFTHARVVVSPQRIVDDATLVLRDGRVVAVGKGLQPPDEATVHDLEGKTIYPGFVDPYSDYGLAAAAGSSTAGESDRPGSAARLEGSRSGLDSWNDAIHAQQQWVDHFRPDPEAAKALLERGVTVVQSARLDGIFRGRGFVASLADGLAGEVVIEPAGRHFAAFDKGSSGQAYPRSLMGSMALIRQTLLDAQWYDGEMADHQADPAQPRPALDRNLAALAANDGPLIFASDNELSLLRAGRLAGELGVELIHLGSQREHRRIDQVAALGQPLILPLVFPARPDELDQPEGELDVTLADLRHWERAPSTASWLAAAGVRFAFTGYGLGKDDDFFANLRRTITRGLAPGIALAALTTVPAELAGVADRVGTLEVGKRADLIISDGDLLRHGQAEIVAVWVGGKPALERQPLDLPDYRGHYRLSLDGERLRLTLEGDSAAQPKGRIGVADADQVDLEGVAISGQVLRFRAEIDSLGGVTRFQLARHGEQVTGEVLTANGRRLPFLLLETEPVAEAESAADEVDQRAQATSSDDEGELISRRTYPDLAFGHSEPLVQQDVLVRGATIWTAADGRVVEGGDLLIRGGKVVAVGRDLKVPRGVRVIDASGKHITPGLIDEHSHLAISGGVNESSFSVSSEVRIGDVVNPDDVGIYRALAGGVTSAQLLHGSSNAIGGQSQAIKLRWGQDAAGLKLRDAPPAIKFALGENVKRSNSDNRSRYPQSRMGVESLMRDAFLAARRYAEERANGDGGRRDLQLEALAEILAGERTIHCHSYVQSEILMLLRLAEELGFRVGTFTHILEGYKVAPELAAHGAMASTFSDWWAYKFEVYDAIPYNTCLLTKHGVVTSVNSDSSDLIRRLNQEAAKSVMYCGMDPAKALELVTLGPARQLGIAHRVGSLAVGKDGDFVVWNGHPLSIYSRVEQTWIEGTRYFDLAEDVRRRSADASEKQALVQKALRAAKPARPHKGGKGRSRDWHDRDWHDRDWRDRDWRCDDTDDVWQQRHFNGVKEVDDAR